MKTIDKTIDKTIELFYPEYFAYNSIRSKMEESNIEPVDFLQLCTKYTMWYTHDLVVFLKPETGRIVKWVGNIDNINELTSIFKFYQLEPYIKVDYEYVKRWKNRGFTQMEVVNDKVLMKLC